nr:hypothetical protein [Deinococcus arenae]
MTQAVRLHVTQDDGEFLPTVSVRPVTATPLALQDLRQLLQHLVPHLMTEGVVDPLEVIDIDQQQGVAGAHGGQVQIELPAVAQAGQGIGQRRRLPLTGEPQHVEPLAQDAPGDQGPQDVGDEQQRVRFQKQLGAAGQQQQRQAVRAEHQDQAGPVRPEQRSHRRNAAAQQGRHADDGQQAGHGRVHAGSAQPDAVRQGRQGHEQPRQRPELQGDESDRHRPHVEHDAGCGLRREQQGGGGAGGQPRHVPGAAAGGGPGAEGEAQDVMNADQQAEVEEEFTQHSAPRRAARSFRCRPV